MASLIKVITDINLVLNPNAKKSRPDMGIVWGTWLARMICPYAEPLAAPECCGTKSVQEVVTGKSSLAIEGDLLLPCEASLLWLHLCFCDEACMPGHVFIRSHEPLVWVWAAACLRQQEYWPLTSNKHWIIGQLDERSAFGFPFWRASRDLDVLFSFQFVTLVGFHSSPENKGRMLCSMGNRAYRIRVHVKKNISARKEIRVR